MNKLAIYYKTAVSLAQLPFYYLSYKVAEIRYRQHMNQSEIQTPTVIVEPTFALAQ